MNKIEVECPTCKGKFDPIQYDVDTKLQFKDIKDLNKPMRFMGVLGFFICCFLAFKHLLFFYIGIVWFVTFFWLWKIDAYKDRYIKVILKMVTGPTYDLLCPYCGEHLTFHKDRVFIAK